jgi:protein transport protein SEC20
MPPIPFDQDVLDLIDAINRRKKDLVEFQIPRLKACKGPLSVQQQYVVEVRDDTEALTRQVEVGRFNVFTSIY